VIDNYAENGVFVSAFGMKVIAGLPDVKSESVTGKRAGTDPLLPHAVHHIDEADANVAQRPGTPIMKTRNFGRLGWDVSEVGFGAWGVGGGFGHQSEDDSVAALHRAFELGCNFVDTAQAYGDGHSERVVARAIREWSQSQHIYVATKIGPQPGTWPPSPYDRIEDRFGDEYLRLRLERSLRDLGTDCIDLLQLHTWTRAWNKNPVAFETLRQLQKEGKVRGIGVSTPEHDQNAIIQLMRDGWIDSAQVIYNIFEQEPQAELFPVALEMKVGIVVRVALDESALTGKLTPQTQFLEGDIRGRYFAGDRLPRTVERVEQVREAVGKQESSMVTAALKFALKPCAVTTSRSKI
jgi:aryl-alcohol dehydrogenase-like predicted oxidoreductase